MQPSCAALRAKRLSAVRPSAGAEASGKAANRRWRGRAGRYPSPSSHRDQAFRDVDEAL